MRIDKPVIWDAANRRHLGQDHPERRISLVEIEEALNDPQRTEEPDQRRPRHWIAMGATRAGRRLYVAWIGFRAGRYPVHAHQLGRRK